MNITTTIFKELSDRDYTRLRKNLLRTKGNNRQREFLAIVRDNTAFQEQFDKVPTVGTIDAAIAENQMTESGERQVQEWIELAEAGAIALPSFQRSYVWTDAQVIADYLLALFRGRPTGIFLVLKTNGRPQFASRPLKGLRNANQPADELLLDGQQRLTSLWNAFNGSATVKYYVKVQDLAGHNVTVEDVLFWPDRSAFANAMLEPRNAYAQNLVPVAILRDRCTPQANIGEIWSWCLGALTDGNKARHLERTIGTLREQVLFRRPLHYFELDAETDKNTAIDIFVQSNKSSVKVNDFDIAVALALNEGDESLRERIGDFHRQSEVTRYYLNVGADDDEGVIAPLGEWLLFGACLALQGVAPKKQRFEDVVKTLFKLDKEEANQRLQNLLTNIERGLNTLADHGVPTRDTLPTLPPLHVLASIQDDLRTVRTASALGISRQLVSAYLWRSFWTERYQAKANDRLFEDYKALRKCIRQIGDTGRFSRDDVPPIFNEDEYPLPDAGMLDIKKPIPWIGRKSRLGRAIVALTLSQEPSEWFAPTRLNARTVRELAGAAKLDKHHVFPRRLLTDKFSNQEINHGLNGVLLSKPENQALSRKDPADYMQWILNHPQAPTEEELRHRVESHLVPYDVITGDGSVEERYEAFIRARADIVTQKILEISRLPGA